MNIKEKTGLNNLGGGLGRPMPLGRGVLKGVHPFPSK